MTNIRTAILRAADTFDTRPAAYDFLKNHKPECDSPGCMMGWIGYFAGVENKSYCYMDDCRAALGFDYTDIGDFVRRLWPTRPANEERMFLLSYQISAKSAAHVLRLFADARFPEAPIKYPDWNALAHQPVPAQGEA